MNGYDLTFSIVISTLDRADPLQTLLQALEAQTYPNFEVIVVVGPTHDHTLEVLARYKDRVRVLHCPQANLARSRNIGLLEARGDIIVFVDDDAVPCRRWLELLAHLFENRLVDATGGVVYLAHPSQPVIQFRIGIMSSLGEQVDVRSSRLEHLIPPGKGTQWFTRVMGCNMAFRREVLLNVGGFDEFYRYIAEETDLISRLVRAGKMVLPTKEAPVYHFPASSRYRKSFSHHGKWWIQTRSMVYFAIKNGLQAGDSLASIGWRCFYLLHGHLLWYTQLLREKEWDLSQYIRGCWGEIMAFCSGVLNGFMMRRRLIKPFLIKKALGSSRPILRFQNEHSGHQPGVDPVTGQRPHQIRLLEPPLQICLLSGSYPPAKTGGIGYHIQTLAKGLYELGHRVHVITHGEKEQVVVQEGVYVHTIPYHLNRYHCYRGFHNAYHILNYSHAVYDQVKRLVLNEGIEVVCSPLWQVEGLVTAVSGILPVVVCLQTTMQQIAELHGSRSQDIDFENMLEQILLEKAIFLAANSSATHRALGKRFPWTLSIPSRVIPHGIIPVPEEETRPFDPGRNDRPFTVLFVGRLEKRKGILDLFQAIPSVIAQVPNTQFVIAGADNSLHDGFQRKAGMSYPAFFAANYSQYVPFVRFMGEVTDEQLKELYQSCDIFVAPSLYESFGLVYLEAMNYAKPVIGCWTGGVPEVVENGITGLLVDPGTPRALAEAIVSLLKSPVKLREMGFAGRQRLLDRFTYIEMAKSFEQVFREAVRLFRTNQEH